MTFEYAHPGVYRCDTDGCPSKEFSPSGELPEGWAVVGVVGEKPLEVVLHRCPKCAKALTS
jgi:hypothetical protein